MHVLVRFPLFIYKPFFWWEWLAELRDLWRRLEPAPMESGALVLR